MAEVGVDWSEKQAGLFWTGSEGLRADAKELGFILQTSLEGLAMEVFEMVLSVYVEDLTISAHCLSSSRHGESNEGSFGCNYKSLEYLPGDNGSDRRPYAPNLGMDQEAQGT